MKPPKPKLKTLKPVPKRPSIMTGAAIPTWGWPPD